MTTGPEPNTSDIDIRYMRWEGRESAKSVTEGIAAVDCTMILIRRE
jgi:hypothetical protein